MNRAGFAGESNPSGFEPLPSAVWETSPGNTQALWFWSRPHTPKRASAFSKALTYRHRGGGGVDPGGSAPNKLLRVPGSFNRKPADEKPFSSLRHYDTRLIFQRPELLPDQGRAVGRQIETSGMIPHAYGSLAVLEKHRSELSASTRSLIRHKRVMAQDRSGRIVIILMAFLPTLGIGNQSDIEGILAALPR
ncbi:hypothetical protein BOO69_02615 [Sulfitobacter alexandrii]|uniref:RepB-like DNA primase domain-containing protein n=1 Tax=Sulfitobacter alexandrii TaxID=1917485 RepID=A0A1J0WE41_9RHOB|nr:hypothetical protein BOO69_02615 [Sulfitobacter alexandrii]